MHQVSNIKGEEKNLTIFIKVKCKTNTLLVLGSIFVQKTDLYLHSFQFTFVSNSLLLFLLVKLPPPQSMLLTPGTHRQICDMNQVLEMIATSSQEVPHSQVNQNSGMQPGIEMLQPPTDTFRRGDVFFTNMEKLNHPEILTH